MSSTAEIPLQVDMFTGELVDTRTGTQRKRDRERLQPQQLEMFAPVEIAQFGINPRPLLSLSEHTRLTLWHEDPRTEEEIEADRLRATQEANYKLPEGLAEVETLAGAETPVVEDCHDQDDEANPDHLDEQFLAQAQFYAVLSEATLPTDGNGRAGLSPEGLAELTKEMVAHIQREVSREGFWEVDWAQEALEEWVWDFLDMYCLIEGDMAEHRATVAAIMDTAHRLWSAEVQEQAAGAGEGDIASVAADETTLALVVYGFWDWPRTLDGMGKSKQL